MLQSRQNVLPRSRHIAEKFQERAKSRSANIPKKDNFLQPEECSMTVTISRFRSWLHWLRVNSSIDTSCSIGCVCIDWFMVLCVPSDEIEECNSDQPGQIGLTQFSSLLHLLERAVDRLSRAIATVTGDLATMATPALRLPWRYMVRVSLPSGCAHWSAAQLLLKAATQLLTSLSLSPSDGDENFVSFSESP